MKKDYSLWTPTKIEINNKQDKIIGYKERDIWLSNIGENIGFEEDGKGEKFVRPVLILKKFNENICHIIPLSTTNKRDKFHFAFDGKTRKTSTAILSQSKTIDTARLIKKIGIISKNDFEKLKKNFINLLVNK